MTYADISREYLESAQEAIGQGDYRQASEKLWGSAAVMVKAVAERRGWEHGGHALLFQAVRRLSDETGDPELSLLFRLAGQLHMNFYENWLPPEDVVQALGEVKRFLGRLEASLNA